VRRVGDVSRMCQGCPIVVARKDVEAKDIVGPLARAGQVAGRHVSLRYPFGIPSEEISIKRNN
jgi:hypothetical protein